MTRKKILLAIITLLFGSTSLAQSGSENEGKKLSTNDFTFQLPALPNAPDILAGVHLQTR